MYPSTAPPTLPRRLATSCQFSAVAVGMRSKTSRISCAGDAITLMSRS